MISAHLVSLVRLTAGLLAGPACAHIEHPPSPEATMHGPISTADSILRMQVERIGSGSPLVLVGGGLTGWASWRPHAERLSAEREVVRLQLLSVQYGLEDRPLPAGYSVRMESQALAAALDELGLKEPVDLAAWSYGAMASLDFALNHPDRVRTLTLIEPPALWVLPNHGRDMADVQELTSVLPSATGEVGIETLKRFVHAAALAPPGAHLESLPQWDTWVEHRRSLRNGPAVLAHRDDVARLRNFRSPVLLVTGEGTSPFLRAIHDAIAAAIPNARTLELSGGHAPHLAEMDVFLERFLDFQASAAHDKGAGVPASAQPDGRQTVVSKDGTPIAFWRSGSGPPLLLVHGMTADHATTWRFVLPLLESKFSVVAMDRRGRGESGDGSAYELRREAEDVVAVAEAIGGPVHILGHSFGALVAIEAALLLSDPGKLVLYEGVPEHRTEYRPGVIEQLEAMHAAGDLEGVLMGLFRDVVGMPTGEVDRLRSQHDAWDRRLRNAGTLPRELRADAQYVFEPKWFRKMGAPTLLLVGENSPPREHRNAHGVAGALPNARVRVLPGQQHAAMYGAPEQFVEEVSHFLEEGSPAST